jgi:hypothetical protein
VWGRSRLHEPNLFLRALQGDSGDFPDQELPADTEEPLWTAGAQVPIGVRIGPGEGMPCRELGEAVRTAFLWVIAAHGGAGASTLRHLLEEQARESPVRSAHGVQESSQAWPCGPGANLAATTLLVARTHGRGLAAATCAARQWASGTLPGIKLVGLVLVHDASRLTRCQRAEVQRVSALTPRCWQIPWQEPWRDLVTPTLADAPRHVRRTVSSVVTRAHEVAAGVVTSKGPR